MKLRAVKKVDGFTLIELSIVLVIISLIVGGIVGGKSLIEAQRVQNVIKEFSTYDAAFTTFFNQYDAYAGDMRDASDYWSGVSNGNGDNTYDGDVGDGYRAWWHLSLAEIISGSYCGQSCGPNGLNMDIGIDVPRAEYYDGAGWLASDQAFFVAAGVKYLRIGTPTTNSNQGHAVTGKHTYQIDKKTDDGIYNTGKVTGGNGWINDGLCFNGGAYTLDSSELGCAIFFEMTVQ